MKTLAQHQQCDVVAVAHDGEEALDLYWKHKPDITILDINMPHLNGVEVLRKIREQDSDSFICMNSGDVIPTLVREIANLGVAGYLVKPVKPEKLMALKQQYIKRQKAVVARAPAPAVRDKSFFPSDEELAYAKTLVDSIDFPAIPEAVLSLQQELMKHEPDTKNISEIISRDIRLSATLLKLVNSAACGFKHKISSIPQAVVILGLKRLKNALLASALRNSFGEAEESYENFWDQAHVTAVTSEILSHAVVGVSPEDAFLAGLFQDAGALICMMKNSRYNEIYRHTHSVVESILDFDRRVFKTTHMAVSYVLARKWELPEQICNAILFSHTIDLSECKSDESVDLRALVSILRVSNYLVGKEAHPSIKIKAEGEQAYRSALEEIMIDEGALYDAVHVIKEAVLVTV